MKYVFKTIKYILLAILIILAIIIASIFIQTNVSPDKVPSVFGYKPFIVLSGSMETELYKGDLAIVKKVDATTLKEQDIIAFRDEEDYVVTHRIVHVLDSNGVISFVTKGDNNNTEDYGSVTVDRVEGIYVGKLKGFGNVFLVLQKPISLVIMIVVIIIGGVLWIVLDNNKLSKSEKEELMRLRKEKEETSEKVE